MTNAALSVMDERIFASMFRAGLADAAVFYRDGTGIGVSCGVLLDRSVQFQNENSGIVSHATVITARRSEIGQEDPDTNSFFKIGSETFFVDQMMKQSDESRVMMIVTPKAC